MELICCPFEPYFWLKNFLSAWRSPTNKLLEPLETSSRLKTSLIVKFFDWDYLHLTAHTKETYFKRDRTLYRILILHDFRLMGILFHRAEWYFHKPRLQWGILWRVPSQCSTFWQYIWLCTRQDRQWLYWIIDFFVIPIYYIYLLR